MFPLKIDESGNYAEANLVQLPEAVTIPTPPTGVWNLYPKNDGWYIQDSTGNEVKLAIAGDTIVPPIEPPNTPNKQQYFFGVLGSTGLNSGVLNQSIDGSTTPQSFYVEASNDYDVYINKIVAVITDTATSISKFGNIRANNINNGWDLKLTEDGNITLLAEGVKSYGDGLAQSGGFSSIFGYGNNIGEIQNINAAGNDTQILPFVMSNDLFSYPALRIGRGNADRLESIVNDDFTGLIDFKVYVYGFKNIP